MAPDAVAIHTEEVTVTELVGVYHANGGILGEAAYVIGKVLGRAHCSLCDVTHSPIRRKASWDSYVASLGVPFRLLHLNELDSDLVQAVDGRSPVVLGLRDGDWVRILEPGDIDDVHGDVAQFKVVLAERLATL